MPAFGSAEARGDDSSLRRWEARRAGVRSAAASALERFRPSEVTGGSVRAAPEVAPRLGGGSLLKGNEALHECSALSQPEAADQFAFLAAQPQIPFRYPEDGCYARAHEMARLLEERGVESEKVFLFGNLRVETRYAQEGFVTWWYHVAPVVQVRDGGDGAARMVIDPSVSSGPLRLNEWISIQTQEHCAEAPLGTTYAEGCFYQFTSRFTYLPGSIELRPDHWLPEDLDDTRRMLEEFSRLSADRAGI